MEHDLVRIPCILMRGGTSRGPFFLASDLPSDPAVRDEVLLSVMGAGHELEIDGIGGGNPVTSKVAIVGRSRVPGADVDYLFAQVKIAEREVDTSPNCGNMLVAVGPFAIQRGLVPASRGTTTVRIFNVNTQKIVEARVCTPEGHVVYDGDVAIDGVPGTAAPVHLAFLDATGSKTGELLPTGAASDLVEGVEVTCIDAAMPVVVIRASDLGKSGYEAPKGAQRGRGLPRQARADPRVAAERPDEHPRRRRSGHPQAGAGRAGARGGDPGHTVLHAAPVPRRAGHHRIRSRSPWRWSHRGPWRPSLQATWTSRPT